MNDAGPYIGHERRASMCADCVQVRANPIANMIAGGQQTITYRCPSCGSTWQATRPAKIESLPMQ